MTSSGNDTRNLVQILMLLDDNTCFRYFYPIISSLRNNRRYHIILLARTEELSSDIHLHFPDITHLTTGYSIDSFIAVKPDIVICYQVWWWGIAPFLELFVKCNIPILHYDHGSLIYLSEYLLENDEYASGYRNDVYRCSHIACWGERGKECWTSYGVAEEKLFVTGAIHLDRLHDEPDSKKVYEILKIPQNKEIIFVYTAFTGQFPHFEEAQVAFMEQLASYIAANAHYHLVIKPHPTEMLEFEQFHCCYPPAASLIANPIEDCSWPEIVRIIADDVVAVSKVVVSPFSSALLTPFSLNIPVVLIQYESRRVQDFISYCKDSIIAVKSAEQLSQAIDKVVSARGFDSSALPVKFNHLNDGNACLRFIALIEEIIGEKDGGKLFYLLEEDELKLSVRRYPFLPYPYHYLIKYHMNKNDGLSVDFWLDEYLAKFNNPCPILRELAIYFSDVCRDIVRVKRYLMLYRKYKALDFELLQIYKNTYLDSDNLT